MSGISASLSAVQTSALSVAVAAQNVANANTPGFKAKMLDQETTAQGGVQAQAIRESQASAPTGSSNVDLVSEALTLKSDKVSYEANLQFLQLQTAMLGNAMDLKA